MTRAKAKSAASARFLGGVLLSVFLAALAFFRGGVLDCGDCGANLQRRGLDLPKGNLLQEVQHVVGLDHRRRFSLRGYRCIAWAASARTGATASSFDSSHLNSYLNRGKFSAHERTSGFQPRPAPDFPCPPPFSALRDGQQGHKERPPQAASP